MKLPVLKLSTYALAGVISIASVYGISHTTVAHAQEQSQPIVTEAITIVASPTRIGEDRSLLLQPGETRQIEARVRNVSETTIDVFSTATDFIIDTDGFTPVPIETENDISNRWSLANWLTIVPNQQTLAPNETGTLNILIQVPEDALPGGRYAMIVHEPATAGTIARLENDPQTSPESASRVSQKVGSLVYVIVDGPINESAFIRDFTFPRFTEYGPVPFTMAVDNQSDLHITPQISVEIYNWMGMKVDTIVLDPKNVFPLMSREFDGYWDKVWGVGLYRAKAIMSFGEAGQVVVAQTSFWLFPVTLMLGIGTIVLGMIAILVAVRRHLIHRANTDQQRIAELEQKLQQMADPDQYQPPQNS